eukprot:600777-Rhodomonas_salina.3
MSGPSRRGVGRLGLGGGRQARLRVARDRQRPRARRHWQRPRLSVLAHRERVWLNAVFLRG